MRVPDGGFQTLLPKPGQKRAGDHDYVVGKAHLRQG